MADAYLLVEGKNDQHVIWALCKQHNLPETFTVERSDQDTLATQFVNWLGRLFDLPRSPQQP